MTNFETIADRIVSAEGVSFAIAMMFAACGVGGSDRQSAKDIKERREALTRAIVEALSGVFADAVRATRSLEASEEELK